MRKPAAVCARSCSSSPKWRCNCAGSSLSHANVIYWLSAGQNLSYLSINSAPLHIGSLVDRFLVEQGHGGDDQRDLAD